MCNTSSKEDTDQLIASTHPEVNDTIDTLESVYICSTPHEHSRSVTVTPVLSDLLAPCHTQITVSVSRSI